MLLSIEPNLHLTRTFLHKPQQIKQEWAYTALFVGRKKFVGEAFIHNHIAKPLGAMSSDCTVTHTIPPQLAVMHLTLHHSYSHKSSHMWAG